MLAFTLAACLSAADPAHPNIVVILADDLGWADVSCQGRTEWQTPQIDRLAQDGLRFRNAFAAAPNCSPTRAALMTGQAPARVHMTTFIPGRDFPTAPLLQPTWCQELPTDRTTLPEALRTAGYRTALIGKWHMGKVPPQQHGFDDVLHLTVENEAKRFQGPQGTFMDDVKAETAARWLGEHADRPFFLYVALNSPHVPLAASQERYRRLRAAGLPPKQAMYGAMVEHVDSVVGRVRARLAELHLDRNTILVFSSDNGGLMLSTSNAPYRGGKANLFDGGLRVPAIVSWPGVTTPGRVDDTPVILTDLFPTLLAAAGVAAPEQPCDGANLLPLIRGAGTRPERDLFWHFPHYTLVPDAVPSSAIRSGRYKLIEWHDRNAATLTDVLDDPGEAHDLAAELPQVVAELRGRLAAWRNSVRAQMATVNPNPDPAWKIMPTTSLFIDPVVRRWMDDP